MSWHSYFPFVLQIQWFEAQNIFQIPWFIPWWGNYLTLSTGCKLIVNDHWPVFCFSNIVMIWMCYMYNFQVFNIESFKWSFGILFSRLVSQPGWWNETILNSILCLFCTTQVWLLRIKNFHIFYITSMHRQCHVNS